MSYLQYSCKVVHCSLALMESAKFLLNLRFDHLACHPFFVEEAEQLTLCNNSGQVATLYRKQSKCICETELVSVQKTRQKVSVC